MYTTVSSVLALIFSPLKIAIGFTKVPIAGSIWPLMLLPQRLGCVSVLDNLKSEGKAKFKRVGSKMLVSSLSRSDRYQTS